MPKSPTQRTLEHLRKIGLRCQVVERWVPQAKRRIDLFGFIDLIAMEHGRIVGIQCCAASGHAAHRHKIMAECTDDAKLWLRSGGAIEIWSWRKVTVGKTEQWINRTERIRIQDFS